MSMTKRDKINILETAAERFGTEPIRKSDLMDVVAEHGFSNISHSYLKRFRAGHGLYDIAQMLRDVGSNKVINFPTNGNAAVKPETETETTETPVVDPGMTQQVMTADFENLVPAKDPLYVKTAHYKNIDKVVRSGRFFPIFITGPSGNGKSLSVVQAAAAAGRELIRVNVTKGTSDDEMIGHWSLINGSTVFQYGPMVEAMRRGAIILIDEIDMLDANRAAGLFTALEGKGVYIKQINEQIIPAAGFNIIATANTKGKGSDDGRFMGTNILNEAFLERFPITLEFDYPTKVAEKKILTKVFEQYGIDDSDFVKNLSDWSAIVRRTFDEGAIDETISTRRLVSIADAYSIFESKEDAIKHCIARFDDEITEALYDLYTKIDDGILAVGENGEEVETEGEPRTGETTAHRF